MSLSSMVKLENLLELLHMFQATILGLNFLVDSNKVHNLTEKCRVCMGNATEITQCVCIKIAVC